MMLSEHLTAKYTKTASRKLKEHIKEDLAYAILKNLFSNILMKIGRNEQAKKSRPLHTHNLKSTGDDLKNEFQQQIMEEEDGGATKEISFQ